MSYTIVFICVAVFADRTGGLKSDMCREVESSTVDTVIMPAFIESGIDWAHCVVSSHGDRTRILVSSDVSKVLVSDLFLKYFAEALRRSREVGAIDHTSQFRVLLHAGEESAIEYASGVLDAAGGEPEAWRAAEALGVIMTDRFRSDAIDQGAVFEQSSYRELELPVDGGSAMIWYGRPEVPGWVLSWLGDLPAEHPTSYRLLQLWAFLSSVPVRLAWFAGAGEGEPPTWQELNVAFAKGIAHRLVTVDQSTGSVQCHPLLQAVLRDNMTDEQRLAARRTVSRLLASLDPGQPTSSRHWLRYRELLPHVTAPHLVEFDDEANRTLVVNVARYLFFHGDRHEAADLARRAWEAWGRDRESESQSLELASYRGLFLWALGRFEEAAEINRKVLARCRQVSGADAEATIIARLRVAVDVRTHGDFVMARRDNVKIHEETRRLFAKDDPIALQTAHDLAVVTRLCGDYRSALELDETTWQLRAAVLGADSADTLLSRSGMYLDRRELGDYRAALSGHEEMTDQLLELTGGENPGTLIKQVHLAVALRRVGDDARALELSGRTHEALNRVCGGSHPSTLACAVGYATDLRHGGRLDEAHAVGEQARGGYRGVFGDSHPLTLVADTNAAVTLRLLGDAPAARKLNQRTLEKFQAVLGADHPHTIACAVNFASDAAALGAVDDAVRIGAEAHSRAEQADRALGAGHPVTLAAWLNLTLDQTAQGTHTDEQHAEIVDRYRRVLGDEHPASVAARARVRADCDIDPLPL